MRYDQASLKIETVNRLCSTVQYSIYNSKKESVSLTYFCNNNAQIRDWIGIETTAKTVHYVYYYE